MMYSERNSDQFPVANIMVVGKTGVGKSTLINAVFKSEVAETGTGYSGTDDISKYQGRNIPICIWDTPGFSLSGTQKTMELITNIFKSPSHDSYDRIHAIWYCLYSLSNRYSEAESLLIKEFYSSGIPVIIVLTKCCANRNKINAYENEIKKINASMGMDDIRIVQTLALPYQFEDISESLIVPAFGLKKLLYTTLELFPEFMVIELLQSMFVNLIIE